MFIPIEPTEPTEPTAETDPDKVGTDKIDTAKIDTAKIDTEKIDTEKIDTAMIGTEEGAQLPLVPGLEVLELIARGGHGSVFCARQENHERLLALKVLDARFVDEDIRRRFDRERIALGRISDHPNIVTLIGSGTTQAGAPFLTLEHAPGGSLADYIKENGPMSLDDATKMTVALASAIEAAHSAEVIHCDIKPANILRSAYGDWMLTDFGIAALIDRSVTSTMQVSYAHTAPETFEGGTPAVTNDVYSLASVLATALTGAEPFEVQPDESPVSAMRRVISDPYPDLRRQGVPDDLAALLERALSKDAAQRPVGARAFAAAINMIRAKHDLMAVPVRTVNEDPIVEMVGATTLVSSFEVDAISEPRWAQPMMKDKPSKGTRRVRALAVVCALLLAIAGLGFGGIGLDSLDFDDVAEFAAGDNDGDGDGPGNGNGPGNNNDGNGNGNGDGNGNGPANNNNDGGNNGDNDGDNDNDDADDGDNDNDDADDDNDGDGNGPGNGPGNGNGGPGDGNGGGNGPGNGGAGNGPGNGGPGNGGPGNAGPGNGNGGPGNGGPGNGNGGPGNGGGN